MRSAADKELYLAAASLRQASDVHGAGDGRYTAKMVETADEFEAVLALRYDVFKRELGGAGSDRPFSAPSDLDEYDLRCEHLIVTERATGRAVGTYRLNTIETALAPSNFYASQEFAIEDLPRDLIDRGVELGRACIAKDHRNSKVLFLLWKVLANFLVVRGKQYLFGCCSIFTQDGKKAAKVLEQLRSGGYVNRSLHVLPRSDKRILPPGFDPTLLPPVELPPLVQIYLRIGCKVCGEPAIDREMRTIDYFVVFDLESIEPRYRKMFFGT